MNKDELTDANHVLKGSISEQSVQKHREKESWEGCAEVSVRKTLAVYT